VTEKQGQVLSWIALVAGVTILAASWVLGAVFSLRTQGRLPGFVTDPRSYARSLVQVGRTNEAIGEYRKAWRIDRGDTTPVDELASLLADSGLAQEGVQAQSEALAVRPLDPRRHTALALALARARRYDEALKQYDVALRLAPRHAPALVGIGDVFWDHGDVGRATQAYARALEADGGSVDAHNKMGVALALTGRPAAAVTEFEIALRLSPDSSEIAGNLGRARADAAKGSQP
jgi:tetratricopeptide (TPR) repeat protein